MNPVHTLQQPFKVPGTPAWGSSAAAGGREGSNNNTPGGGRASDRPLVSGRTGQPFVLQTQDNYSHGSTNSAWSESAARAVKRAKTNNASAAGLVYRDGESTGYEDDGSEAPMVDDWVAIHKPTSNGSTALRDHSNIAGGAASTSKNGPGFVGLNPKRNDAASASVACTRYFECQWRKPQNKKHKTWEGDGILKVTGGKASLHDQSNSTLVASGRLAKDPDHLLDETFQLGGKELQIDREIPAKDYLKGSVFGNKPVVPASRPAATPATSTTTSFYGKPAVASTSSFYGSSTASKGITKKFTAPTVTRPSATTSFYNSPSQSAYAPTNVGLPPVKSFYSSKGKNREDPSDFEGPDTRLQAGLDSFPSSRSNSINFRPTARSTSGLGAAPKEPKSLFKTDTPGALVMKRLEPDLERQLNKKDLPVVDVVIDPILSSRMRDHQKEGIKFLYESVMGMRSEGHGCILADEMGLGKTIQAIALVYTLLKQTPFFGGPTIIQQAVIVCPVTLVKNWRKEFQKWLGKDRIRVFTAETKQSVKNFVQGAKHWHVLIIGYERLRTVVNELSKANIGLMICDEGHRLKSAGAKTTKALQELNVEKRVILSGTPIQNELSEFHSMVDFVNPGILDSYASFKKIFEFPIMKSRQPDCTPDQKELGQYRAESLNEATSPFILRRTSEVIQGFLPPKSEYVVFIAPTPIQKQLYAHVLASDAVKSFMENGKAALVLIDLLKKICNSPTLLMRQEEMEKANAEIVRSALTLMPPNARSMGPALSGKMKALQSMLRTLRDGTDEKIVVVSNFVQTLNLIQSLCERERYGYCRLDGSTKPEERQSLVDKFNKSSQEHTFVFMLSTKAGGTGLNIVGASRLVLFDSDWNPANDLQAMGRIHRDGQKKECFIYRFITTGTIDEKIFQRQITKIGLADSVMQEGTGKAGKDSDAFTTQQLRALFKPCEDTPCETHDQLICGCKTGARYVMDGSGEDDEMEIVEPAVVAAPIDDSDSEDDLPDIPAFVKASQYKLPKSKVDPNLGKTLAVLKEWLHVNCQTNDERKADNVQDDVLRDMVLRSMEAMRIAPAKVNDSDNDSDDEENGIKTILPVLKPRYTGGEVTFVFHKKKGALDASVANSPEAE